MVQDGIKNCLRRAKLLEPLERRPVLHRGPSSSVADPDPYNFSRSESAIFLLERDSDPTYCQHTYTYEVRLDLSDTAATITTVSHPHLFHADLDPDPECQWNRSGSGPSFNKVLVHIEIFTFFYHGSIYRPENNIHPPLTKDNIFRPDTIHRNLP